jgi:transposase
LGEGGLAPHQKKARGLKASLVFIDESGLLLAPVVRRSWAPCGQTPILYQRGRAREKVSIIAALTLSLLVWDRLPGHRAQVVTEYLHHRHRAVALLPPYAPELNPVEILWAYLKTNPLANFAASDAAHLAHVATRHVQRLRRRAELLRSFFDATPLFFSRG